MVWLPPEHAAQATFQHGCPTELHQGRRALPLDLLMLSVATDACTTSGWKRKQMKGAVALLCI